MDTEPEEFELVDWLQADVHRKVAELLEHEHLVQQLDALLPTDDREFDEGLATRELALMADGVPRAAIAFRLAVVRATARRCWCRPRSARPGQQNQAQGGWMGGS